MQVKEHRNLLQFITSSHTGVTDFPSLHMSYIIFHFIFSLSISHCPFLHFPFFPLFTRTSLGWEHSRDFCPENSCSIPYCATLHAHTIPQFCTHTQSQKYVCQIQLTFHLIVSHPSGLFHRYIAMIYLFPCMISQSLLLFSII